MPFIFSSRFQPRFPPPSTQQFSISHASACLLTLDSSSFLSSESQKQILLSPNNFRALCVCFCFDLGGWCEREMDIHTRAGVYGAIKKHLFSARNKSARNNLWAITKYFSSAARNGSASSPVVIGRPPWKCVFWCLTLHLRAISSSREILISFISTSAHIIIIMCYLFKTSLRRRRRVGKVMKMFSFLTWCFRVIFLYYYWKPQRRRVNLFKVIYTQSCSPPWCDEASA